jgi:DNA-binding NarL/FixJ family response regulator
MNRRTVLLADDHPMFRRGLREAVEEAGRYKVVAEAGDGDTAIRQIGLLSPMLAVIDLAMPGRDGLEVLAWLEGRSPTRAVVLTMYRDAAYVDRAIELGAVGYLVKDDAQDEILRCLDLVCEGEFYLSPGIGLPPQAAPDPAGSGQSKGLLALLTPAQLAVLRLLAECRTSKEIARTLGISAKTVDNHRTNISARLNLYGANALLRFAVRHRGHL